MLLWCLSVSNFIDRHSSAIFLQNASVSSSVVYAPTERAPFAVLIGQILALVAVRKALDYVFSQHDLGFLDDVIPEKDKKKKEDEKKKKKKKQGSIDSDMEDVSVLNFFFYY